MEVNCEIHKTKGEKADIRKVSFTLDLDSSMELILQFIVRAMMLRELIRWTLLISIRSISSYNFTVLIILNEEKR